jgi:CRP/FNR family cyclic AMP-dependent transcriptional regulator
MMRIGQGQWSRTKEKSVISTPMNIQSDTQTNESTALRPLETAIAQHPFLQGLSPKHLKTLAEVAMFTDFTEGQLVFSEGEPANRFYLVQEGRVAVEAHGRDANTALIQTIGAGDVLGWSWLFPPYHWHFDARAVEPTKAICFYGTRLREACEEDHDLGYELMKRTAAVVVQRLQATRRQFLEAEGILCADAEASCPC